MNLDAPSEVQARSYMATLLSVMLCLFTTFIKFGVHVESQNALITPSSRQQQRD